jgi:hypothetical protein
MFKEFCVVCLLCLSSNLWCQQGVKKLGKLSEKSPYVLGDSALFLPYNPTFLVVGPDSYVEVLDLERMREKSTVYCFEQDRSKFQMLEQKTRSYKNIHLFPYVFGHQKSGTLTDWCREQNLSKIDVLLLNATGDQMKILRNARELLNTVKVVFISTCEPRVPFRNPHQFLRQHGFELLTHWEGSNRKGQAFFVKTSYYKAVYERQLI